MGAVLGTTLGIAFSAIDLPPAVVDRLGMPTEAFVSGGGAELPDRIIEVFEAEAASAPDPVGSDEIRAEGERLAEETAVQVRNAFAVATSRIYWLTALLVVIAAWLTSRIPELPLRTTHDRAAVAGSEAPTPGSPVVD